MFGLGISWVSLSAEAVGSTAALAVAKGAVTPAVGDVTCAAVHPASSTVTIDRSTSFPSMLSPGRSSHAEPTPVSARHGAPRENPTSAPSPDRRRDLSHENTCGCYW